MNLKFLNFFLSSIFRHFVSVFFIAALSSSIMAQEKVCIPNVWKGEVIKGTVYLENGDSLKGKFTHLTPYNDIKTTHISYKGKNKEKANIYRKEIKAYFDDKKKEYRLRVYVDSDSVIVKKDCFFDQGKFLKVIEDGDYILLQDELNYYSSLEAYSQTYSTDIFYLLKPNKELIKISMNDCRYQLLSFMSKKQKENFALPSGEFSKTDVIRAVEVLNTY